MVKQTSQVHRLPLPDNCVNQAVISGHCCACHNISRLHWPVTPTSRLCHNIGFITNPRCHGVCFPLMWFLSLHRECCIGDRHPTDLYNSPAIFLQSRTILIVRHWSSSRHQRWSTTRTGDSLDASRWIQRGDLPLPSLHYYDAPWCLIKARNLVPLSATEALIQWKITLSVAWQQWYLGAQEEGTVIPVILFHILGMGFLGHPFDYYGTQTDRWQTERPFSFVITIKSCLENQQ